MDQTAIETAAPRKQCPYCFKEINHLARKCPECLSDLQPRARFNLEGWSKLVAFTTALITVTSLSADKLSSLFLVLTGQDASRIDVELTDIHFADPKPDAQGQDRPRLLLGAAWIASPSRIACPPAS